MPSNYMSLIQQLFAAFSCPVCHRPNEEAAMSYLRDVLDIPQYRLDIMRDFDVPLDDLLSDSVLSEVLLQLQILDSFPLACLHSRCFPSASSILSFNHLQS